jgi:hypothetical protein
MSRSLQGQVIIEHVPGIFGMKDKEQKLHFKILEIQAFLDDALCWLANS